MGAGGIEGKNRRHGSRLSQQLPPAGGRAGMVVIEVDDKMKALVMRLNELPGLQRLLTRMKIHGVFINTASVDGKEPDEKLIALDGNHDTLRPPPLNPVFSLCNDTH